MDCARDEASEETSCTLSGIQVLQGRDCATNHSILLLAHDQDSRHFERMGESYGAQSETSIHWHPLIAESLRQERRHEYSVASQGCRVSEGYKLRHVGEVGHDLTVARFGESRGIDNLSLSHENIEWLGKSRASEQLNTTDIKRVSTAQIVDHRDSEKGHHTTEGTVFELTSLIHRYELFTEVLSTLFVELSVEDTVRLCNVEGVRDVLIHFYSYYYFIN